MQFFLTVFAITIVVAVVTIMLFLTMLNRVFSPQRIGNFAAKIPNGQGEIITINDFNLWIRIAGAKSGKTVVVLHGGPGLSSLYFKDSLQFLENNCQVVHYDQRGCGYSEVKDDKELYKMKYHIEDLERLRKDVLKKDKIILLAHSAGCQLAMRYAIQYQYQVEKLILVSPSSALFNYKDALRYSLKLLMNGIPSSDPVKANEWYAKALLSLFNKTFNDRKNVNLLNAMGNASFAPACYIGQSIQNSIYAEIKKLSTNTLIIYGKDELFYTNEAIQMQLHAALQNSLIEKFTRSGHWAFFEEPEKFREVVGSFIKNVKPQGARQ